MVVTFLTVGSDYIVILGGFGLGNAVGLLAHYGRTISGDPPPKLNLEVPAPDL